MANTNPARGMRDFLPSDIRKRNYVINIIKEVYESYGFEPLETPAVENIETLMGKYGEEGNQLIFKILKRGEHEKTGEADLALRYDLTVPTARVIANNKNELPKFFKRYQIQPVWRADRPARGRFREFYQCDVDAIGSKSMVVEAELISAVCEILQQLGFKDFIVKVNHREFLFKMLESFGIPQELQNVALIAIDKLDKLTIQEVAVELLEKGISQTSVDKLSEHFNKTVTNFNSGNEHVVNSLSMLGEGKLKLELRTLIEFVDNQHVRLYPYLARGLSYYTGAIFEIVLTKGDFAGSIGGGGRYDGLIGMFGKEEIPACGFSLGLERILVVMEERDLFRKPIEEGKLKLDSADVMIACFDPKLAAECLKLAGELRRSNKDLRVLVYPELSQKGKPKKYAKQIKVKYVCLIKEDELAENKVSLTNMTTDVEEPIAREEVSTEIKKLMSSESILFLVRETDGRI